MSKLSDIALNSGAPIVSQILKGFGPIGMLAGGVIEMIAGRLDTDPTPEAIEGKFQSEPEVVQQVIREIDADYTEIVKQGHETARSWHRVLEGDRDSEHALTRLWRPVTALFFGPCCLLVLATACWVLLNQIPISSEALTLVGVIVPTITALSGFCGWYATKRSQEKGLKS